MLLEKVYWIHFRAFFTSRKKSGSLEIASTNGIYHFKTNLCLWSLVVVQWTRFTNNFFLADESIEQMQVVCTLSMANGGGLIQACLCIRCTHPEPRLSRVSRAAHWPIAVVWYSKTAAVFAEAEVCLAFFLCKWLTRSHGQRHHSILSLCSTLRVAAGPVVLVCFVWKFKEKTAIAPLDCASLGAFNGKHLLSTAFKHSEAKILF